MRQRCVLLPTSSYPQGPRNGRRAEAKSLLPQVLLHSKCKELPCAWGPGQENHWLSGNKSFANSHLQPGQKEQTAEQVLSSNCRAEGTSQGPAASVLTPCASPSLPTPAGEPVLRKDQSFRQGEQERGLGSLHPCRVSRGAAGPWWQAGLVTPPPLNSVSGLWGHPRGCFSAVTCGCVRGGTDKVA